MCNRIRASVAASVTVAAWLLSAAPAAADPVVGPPLGATKYASVVDGPDGDPDVDQYAVDLVAGEAMTLTVAAARNSSLLPDVSLVKPDGTVLSGTALPTVVTAGGKKVALKAFAVDESGRWGVRVGGKDGTEGAYTLASKFKAPKAGSARGAIDPATAQTFDFAAIEGATATVTLSWKPSSAVVDFTSFLAPDGTEVAGATGALFDESVLRRTTRSFKAVELPGPEGLYRLAFASDVPATFNVKVTVKPPQRPSSKQPIALPASEPRIASVASPVRTVSGRRVHVSGSGFSVSPLPLVFFGDAAAANVVVAADGTSLDADAPPGADGALLSATVQNPDGQSAMRPDYLRYVPLPTVTDLTDSAGAAVRLGNPIGGRALRLLGSGFETGYVVRFGSAAADGVDVQDSGTITLRTPAGVPGGVSVSVTDDLGRTVTAPFQFTYKAAPTFAATPYNPVAGAPAGGTEITVTGTGFESEDVLRFDGAVLTKTHLSGTSFKFNSPSKTAGTYPVSLTDLAGTAVSGPSFLVKGPPAFGSSPYSPAAGTVAGGTLVTVTGTGFASDDVLKVDGSVISTTFVSATSFRFSSPAKSAGTYSLSLTDRFGAVVTGPTFPVKAPPTFASSPYSPPGGTTAGGTIVTLTGTGFENDDVLRVDGGVVGKTHDSSTSARFATPAKTAGNYSVTLTDRTGTVVTGPTLEIKAPPAFGATPYSPAVGSLAGGTVVTVTGTGFSSDDVFRFDGSVLSATFVSSTSFQFTTPAKAAGKYKVSVTDRLGGAANGPDFEVKGEPKITSIAVVTGAFSGANGVPFAGGTTIRVTGTGFATSDTVELGGVQVTTSNVTGTQFDFDVPASETPGGVTLAVTDAFGQTGSLDDALRYVGFLDATTTRTPSPTGADAYTAWSGALGDLDGDSSADDLVLASEYNFYGYRTELTRLRLGDGTALNDVTPYNIPSAYSDANGRDRWSARTVALGDLDGDSDVDIAFAGYPPSYYSKYTYSYKAAHEVRVFSNDGSGGFKLDEGMSSGWDHPTVYGSFRGYVTYKIFSHTEPGAGIGTTTDMALGDLDGDGDDEIVTSSDLYRAGYFHGNPNYVNVGSGQKYYAIYKGFSYTPYGYYHYRPALRIHDNQGGSFREVSFPRLPDDGSGYLPAFPGRALALGDVDSDSDLDIVVTWDEPTTTTAYYMWNGPGYGKPQTATSVLVNDGAGWFSDATSYWMPSAGSPEFWQGNRMALTDLDGDSDPDLVILEADSIASFQGKSDYSTSALRVLRNDGSGTGFTDVTSSAVPSVPLAGTADDNLRGNALAVGDVNGDGYPDILVGTLEGLADDQGNPARRTRLLLGGSGLTFSDGTAFLPPVSADSGESYDLKLGDIAGREDPSLVLMSLFGPHTSAEGRILRVFDWYR